MHWRPDILPDPVSIAELAQLDLFLWLSMLILFRLGQDAASASTQAQELGKASVFRNVHITWDLRDAVPAEPS